MAEERAFPTFDRKARQAFEDTYADAASEAAKTQANVLGGAFATLSGQLTCIDGRLSQVERDVSEIKTDVREIKVLLQSNRHKPTESDDDA